MSQDLQTPHVGYVTKMFPRLSETFILNEILELERQGAKVTIFSIKKPSEGQFHPQLSQLKARVLYLEGLDPKKWPIWIGQNWQTLEPHRENLWHAIEQAVKDPDVSNVDEIWWSAWVAAQSRLLGIDRLHAHFASLPSTIAYLANQISGIPFSFTAHAKDIFVYENNEHHLQQKLTAADSVVTVTAFNRRYLADKYNNVDNTRLKVIHNGIDLSLFVPVDASRRRKELILSVGRLVPKKGFDDLLQACVHLKQSGQNFECWIVGDGPEADSLLALRKSLGLQEEVQFTGPKNLEEVRQMMQQATLFCLPCKVAEDNNQDALPTVLLEALASGLPVVSTTISGIPEIVETGKEGFLVPADHPTALADKMASLLADPELRQQCGLRGREKATNKFDLKQNVVKLLETVFKSNSPWDGTDKTRAGGRVTEATHANE
ncbi:MAG: glycosyltransferase family 4 protein [Candidatus Zixiibacteriota bacterium]